MYQIACINVRIYCNSYVISNDRVILCNEVLSGIAVLATLIDLVEIGSLIIRCTGPKPSVSKGIQCL